MSKSKRLVELMMTVNRKRRFKVRELADEFGVSTRTILRDLQELSELGVPLYSEVGPHGGYQVIRERILPPIAFTEKEAAAIFFAVHALRHYTSRPFDQEFTSALSKFYLQMPGDVRDHIDSMKQHVDLVTPIRRSDAPCLDILLEAAIDGKVLTIAYRTKDDEQSTRHIQPIFLYATNGLWYCHAYCFLRADFRVFRCDRIRHAAYDETGVQPIAPDNGDPRTRKQSMQAAPHVRLRAALSRTGVQQCEAELWLAPWLHIREDGSGTMDMNITREELPFYTAFFIGLGDEVKVEEPTELKASIRRKLTDLLARYS